MRDLLADTAALVDVSSVSRNEGPIADLIESELRSVEGLDVTRIENNVIARTMGGSATRLLLGGHLDTVPPSGNERAAIDGDRCSGCGSGDMKGGLAVMAELARSARFAQVDMTYVFYACEEVARAESGLLAIHAARPDLLECDTAILLEPTRALVEAGCQGVLRATIDLGGSRAHTACPWMGTNAIHRLEALLGAIASFEEREPVIDGCRFHESVQAVKVSGGVASNVVPDHVLIEVSMRFAPDRDAADAETALYDHLSRALDPLIDRFEVVDAAPSAAPSLSSPMLAALVAHSAQEPRAKLGWTDVAFFAERGIPATNFGPGDPELADSVDEFVVRDELDAVYGTLRSLIG